MEKVVALEDKCHEIRTGKNRRVLETLKEIKELFGTRNLKDSDKKRLALLYLLSCPDLDADNSDEIVDQLVDLSADEKSRVAL